MQHWLLLLVYIIDDFSMAFNSTPFEDGLGHFGPELPGHFDFSPLFEFSILSILPSALLLIALPFRLKSLYKQSRKVSRSLLHGNKLVRLLYTSEFFIC